VEICLNSYVAGVDFSKPAVEFADRGRLRNI
jgi:hypothetical protein